MAIPRLECISESTLNTVRQSKPLCKMDSHLTVRADAFPALGLTCGHHADDRLRAPHRVQAGADFGHHMAQELLVRAAEDWSDSQAHRDVIASDQTGELVRVRS